MITVGDYTANITADLIVEIRYLDELIDWPGPWDTYDAAADWAKLRVAELAENGHTAE